MHIYNMNFHCFATNILHFVLDLLFFFFHLILYLRENFVSRHIICPLSVNDCVMFYYLNEPEII